LLIDEAPKINESLLTGTYAPLDCQFAELFQKLFAGVALQVALAPAATPGAKP
jgi:hypothetical protein